MLLGLLSSMLTTNATPENPAFSLNDPEAWDLFRQGEPASSGESVTPRSAMSLGAMWQGVGVISGDVANATLNVHKDDGDREIDRSHPAQFLVSSEPNDETPAFEFWRRLMLHAILWQNAYAWIDRGGRRGGAPAGLYNLLPDRTFPKRAEDGTLYYMTEVDGNPQPLFRDEVLHVKGMSLMNGIGLSLVVQARNAIGLALAAEGFGAKFFANGSMAGGILEIPASWKETAAENLEIGWSKRTKGKDNWFRTAILRDGAKWQSTTVDPQKAQMGELRNEQVREIARFLMMPPSKLGLKDSVSYNSQEQAQIEYVTSCLAHWFGAISGECEMKLLSPEERRSGSRYMEHNYSKLIEVDTKTMAEVLQIERNAEVINANEWRRKINLPLRKDPKGNEYVNPNTKSAAAVDSEKADPAAKKKAADPAVKPAKPANEISKEVTALVHGAITRMARRVAFDAKASSKKPAKLLSWLDSKANEHRDVFHESVLPVANLVAAMTDQRGDDLCYAWAGRFFNEAVSGIDAVTKPPHSSTELEANVEKFCAEFESRIATEIATNLF
jgi:HK97 family phage portal protein